MLGKKTVIVVLLALAFVVSVYAGADQIHFQSQKAEYISAAKQYASDLVSADNITNADCEKGTVWILANQKKKRAALFRKYSRRSEPDRTSSYLKELSDKLSKGWKWHDERVEDIQAVSAWKSPFGRNAHITLLYSAAVQCDSGGAVVYEGNVASLKSENGRAGIMRTYSRNDFLVSCDGKNEVEILSNQQPNSGDSQECVALQYRK